MFALFPRLVSALISHLSMKFILSAIVLVCGSFLFYRNQQEAVRRSYLNKQHVMEQNELLRKKNKDMVDGKKKLEADEKQYVLIRHYLSCFYRFSHLRAAYMSAD
jgi:hypothetical protein